ncbi:alpha/beta fold hydrolase [Egicoccus sp. AB-alg2]|uniref:alpha/beta fold hydrolase n=1 Tax=Egicoccus sp. AB-alg2 TaxID=3242693 RepID=UPI00359DBA2B
MQTTRSVATHEAAAMARKALLEDVPMTERQLRAAGIDTALLEGGNGPPIVLLHGPGESAVNWRWVMPDLAETHHVIAPDLPAHGSSGGGDEDLDEDRVVDWLDDLIAQRCSTAPVVVGHVLGGAIGARYAIRHGDRLEQLVLVDSLGLAPFRPTARFATSFVRFAVRPTERSYERFMGQCAYDLDALRADMGDEWPVFVAYNLGLARSPRSRAAGRLFRRLGVPRIPDMDLARIEVGTALIWGRHDRANPLAVAEHASRRHGWPLRVIEEAADDPPRDQPAAFLRELRAVIDPSRPATPRAGTS